MNNSHPGYKIAFNIKAMIERKDLETLYSIEIATFNVFSYELLIVSYKNRLYHISNNTDPSISI